MTDPVALLEELAKKWRHESKRIFDRSCQTADRASAASDLTESEAFMNCADDLTAAIALMRGQSDMVLVPRELTYENGAKAAFMGEFFVETTIPCGDCDGSGYEDEDGDVPCVICDGEGYVPYRLPVGWTLVKEIHKAIIAHFHPSPKDPADEQ